MKQVSTTKKAIRLGTPRCTAVKMFTNGLGGEVQQTQETVAHKFMFASIFTFVAVNSSELWISKRRDFLTTNANYMLLIAQGPSTRRNLSGLGLESCVYREHR